MGGVHARPRHHVSLGLRLAPDSLHPIPHPLSWGEPAAQAGARPGAPLSPSTGLDKEGDSRREHQRLALGRLQDSAPCACPACAAEVMRALRAALAPIVKSTGSRERGETLAAQDEASRTAPPPGCQGCPGRTEGGAACPTAHHPWEDTGPGCVVVSNHWYPSQAVRRASAVASPHLAPSMQHDALLPLPHRTLPPRRQRASLHASMGRMGKRGVAKSTQCEPRSCACSLVYSCCLSPASSAQLPSRGTHPHADQGAHARV